MRTIVVTPEGTEKTARPFVEALSAHGLDVTAHAGSVRDIVASQAWREAEIVVGAGLDCGASELDAAPLLRAIVSLTIGYEGVDVDAASARQILVVNGTTSENYESMAEATILLVLALLYDLPGAQRRLQTDSWYASGLRSQMLKGKTVGIIGFGNIARSVLVRLQGWGIRLLVHARRLPSSGADHVEFVSLDDLLSQSDVVLPMISLNASSAHLLDANRLALMKPGAFIVNTARGGLIDEDALQRLIASGRIGGAALDVFETEPLPPESPLRDLPGAILTPHDIGHTRESSQAMMRLSVQNVVAVARGEVPENAININAVPGWSIA